METFEEHYSDLQATLSKYMPGTDMELIDKAINYARDKHQDQKRKDARRMFVTVYKKAVL